MLDVALLGTGGMMPLPDRFLTSLMLRLEGRMMLIDCGECTQVTMKQLGWGFKNIDVICFTHYHADHISGLPGLLLTIGNSARTEPLTLVGPKGLVKVYEGLKTICPELPFQVNIVELEPNESINISVFNINSLKVNHKITCYAYRVDVKRAGRFNVEKAVALNVPKKVWSILQKQPSAEFDGKIYTSDMVLGDGRKGLSVSYCTDTRPVDALPNFVKDSDLFICEGMYGEEEKINKAREYKHMLFSEAARIAKQGNVKELWLTHFSPAMPFPEMYIKNAKNIFENTLLGQDRKSVSLMFENEK
ncbi:MAG: ribonuclease Z [Eubacterium sp.]|nr:ribonuclease Z [Eubacterium sp.]